MNRQKGLVMSMSLKPCLYLTVLLMVAGLLAPAAFGGGGSEEAKARTVSLTELRKAPESYRGIPCEFVLVFHEYSQVYNPFFTRFVPEKYMNMSAWGDEQKIWEIREYTRDYCFLFVDKENTSLPGFLKLKRFDRIRVVGTIKDMFRGAPWIEVHSMTPVKGKLTQKSLIHRVRGDVAMKKNRPRIAAKEYNQALSFKDLPPEYLLDVMKNLGMALYRSRDFVAANKVFSKLAKIRPEDKDSKILAVQSAARNREQDKVKSAQKGVVIEMEPVAEEKPEEKPAPEEKTDTGTEKPATGEGAKETKGAPVPDPDPKR